MSSTEKHFTIHDVNKEDDISNILYPKTTAGDVLLNEVVDNPATISTKVQNENIPSNAKDLATVLNLLKGPAFNDVQDMTTSKFSGSSEDLNKIPSVKWVHDIEESIENNVGGKSIIDDTLISSSDTEAKKKGTFSADMILTLYNDAVTKAVSAVTGMISTDIDYTHALEDKKKIADLNAVKNLHKLHTVYGITHYMTNQFTNRIQIFTPDKSDRFSTPSSAMLNGNMYTDIVTNNIIPLYSGVTSITVPSQNNTLSTESINFTIPKTLRSKVDNGFVAIMINGYSATTKKSINHIISMNGGAANTYNMNSYFLNNPSPFTGTQGTIQPYVYLIDIESADGVDFILRLQSPANTAYVPREAIVITKISALFMPVGLEV